MHFDALTLACLTHELKAAAQETRVQQILMPDDQSLGFELYGKKQRHYLFLSADPNAGRVYLSTKKLRRGTDAQPPLLLRLRKLARGAFLRSITQPDAAERILRIELDHPQHGVSTLLIELIGRQSNILLLGPDGRILECMRRFRPPKERSTGQRTILPGRQYAPPQPMNQVHPLDGQLMSKMELLSKEVEPSEKVRTFLVQQISGVSPTQARELSWRAAGDAEARMESTTAVDLANAVQALWAAVGHGRWLPGMVIEDGQVIGFVPYELHFRGEFRPTDSISQALERFFTQRIEGQKTAAPSSVPSAKPSSSHSSLPGSELKEVDAIDPYAALRRTVADQIRSAHQRIDRQLSALSKDEPKRGEPDELRMKAEWLLALSSQLDNEQDEVTIELGDQTMTIARVSGKTPVEQAEQMFDRAAKLERAAIFIPQRRETLLNDRTFLAQLEVDLAQAENQPEVAAVQNELRQAGYLPTRQKPMQKGGAASNKPRQYVSTDGYAILVGRNARQNDQLTFKIAGGADLWFHVRDVPGSHVVLRSGGQPMSDETVQVAAQFAAYYSQKKGERAVPVAYTECRFVTRVPGGHPGLVHMRNEKTVTVPAELPAL
ncbi:MAG: NFACT family protein [Chloroflexota bacterium]